MEVSENHVLSYGFYRWSCSARTMNSSIPALAPVLVACAIIAMVVHHSGNSQNALSIDADGSSLDTSNRVSFVPLASNTRVATFFSWVTGYAKKIDQC